MNTRLSEKRKTRLHINPLKDSGKNIEIKQGRSRLKICKETKIVHKDNQREEYKSLEKRSKTKEHKSAVEIKKKEEVKISKKRKNTEIQKRNEEKKKGKEKGKNKNEIDKPVRKKLKINENKPSHKNEAQTVEVVKESEEVKISPIIQEILISKENEINDKEKYSLEINDMQNVSNNELNLNEEISNEAKKEVTVIKQKRERKLKKEEKIGGVSTEERKEVVKKIPKKFVKGKWNPKIEQIHIDLERESDSSEFCFKCCVECQNRSFIRAILTNNVDLYNYCLSHTKKVSSLFDTWSSNIKKNSLYYALIMNNLQFVLLLLDYIQKPILLGYRYDYLIRPSNTGHVSKKAYGVRVRRVNISRGNRQGNDSFLDKSYEEGTSSDLEEFKQALKTGLVEINTIEKIISLYPTYLNKFIEYLHFIIISGNRKVAAEIIKKCKDQSFYGFNQLFFEVLSFDNEPLSEFHHASVHKKANENDNITPIHCACINPNPQYITKLLSVDSSNINLQDKFGRKPIHYAAACEKSSILEELFDQGANLSDLDKKKDHVLIYACKSNRLENVKFICEEAEKLILTKNRNKMLPIHYAAKKGYTSIVVELIKRMEKKRNITGGPDRMTALSFAASYNHYETVEALIELKCNVNSKDKFKRTPLIMAVKNGNAKIVSLLLKRGALFDLPDSSGNSALHYAVAFGWQQCVDLLIKAEVNINLKNSWNITPLCIGVLKNHFALVRNLLDIPGIDPNSVDEKGRTLVSLCCDYTNEDTLEYLRFLVEIKKINVNLADIDGNTPLHHICNKPIADIFQRNNSSYLSRQGIFGNSEGINSSNQNILMTKNQVLEFRKEFINILISNGADAGKKNNKNENAFDICLKVGNNSFLDQFADKVYFSLNPNLMFSLIANFYDPFIKDLFYKLLYKEKLTKEILNYPNNQGFTVFNEFINQFPNHCSKFQGFYNSLNSNYSNSFGYNQSGFLLYNPAPNAINGTLSLEANNVETINLKIFNEYINPLIEVLCKLTDLGADPSIAIMSESEVHEYVQKFNQNIMNKVDPFQNIGNLNSDNIKQNEKENSWHLAFRCPYQKIFDTLQKFNIPFDVPNRRGETPFYQLINNSNYYFPLSLSFDEIFSICLSMNVKIDVQDIVGITPFILAVKQNNMHKIELLLNSGANINHYDINKDFPLLFAINQNNYSLTQYLILKGANVNQRDKLDRISLHHAVNNSNTSECQLKTIENLLLANKADVNAIDKRGRSPLFYAFVKRKDFQNSSFIDPIELVTNLCTNVNIDVTISDNWRKTPLHYAAQRGSTISSLYLLNRGANINTKDVFHNTPLAIAIMNCHYDYSILLIEKGAKVNVVAHQEYCETEASLLILKPCIKDDEEDLIGDESDFEQEEMEDDSLLNNNNENAFLKQNAQSNLNNNNLFYQEHNTFVNQANQAFFGQNQQNPSSSFSGGSLFNQPSLFSSNMNFGSSSNLGKIAKFSQFNFGNEFKNFLPQSNSLGKDTNQNNCLIPLNLNQNPPLFSQNQPFSKTTEILKKKNKYTKNKSIESNSRKNYINNPAQVVGEEPILKICIRLGNCQGLIYIIIDKKYDFMIAIQDALSEKKFQMVLKLLTKVPSDGSIKKINKKGQNLMHILSIYGGYAQFEEFREIFAEFQRLGININVKDIYSRIPLHYACEYSDQRFVEILIKEGSEVNCFDNFELSPFGISMMKKSLNDLTIPLLLLKNKANPNVLIPSNYFDLKTLEEYKRDEKFIQKTSPLIKLTLELLDAKLEYRNQIMYNNYKEFLNYEIKCDLTDSEGRDVFIYHALKNSVDLLELILEKGKSICKNLIDKAGKTAMHYAVQRYDIGYYEHQNLVKLLLNNGFDFILKNRLGFSPLDYAFMQPSGVLAKLFQAKGVTYNNFCRLESEYRPIKMHEWSLEIDYNNDFETFLKLIELEEEKILQQNIKKCVRIDPVGTNAVQEEVVVDSENSPFDTLLTKVDLKNGLYGEYVFYKMQIILNKVRNVFILSTRWGRIGEQGAHQKTPFPNLEEATKEFCNVFKNKSGNTWNAKREFEKINHKYRVMEINYNEIKYSTALHQFDHKNPKVSFTGKRSIKKVLKLITNVSLYNQSAKTYGLNTDVIPITKLKKERIEEAMNIIENIDQIISHLDLERSKGISADNGVLNENYNKIYDLSNAFYELIPSKEHYDEMPPIIDSKDKIQKIRNNLYDLLYLETAGKILLGATSKENFINPLDYCYKSMGCSICELDRASDEYKIISSYVMDSSSINLINIYSLQRRGDYETFLNFESEPRILLFHGTKLCNYLSILTEGLRISPSSDTKSGSLLGEGIYFADSFRKASNYCDYSYNYKFKLMLICEVALGKTQRIESTNAINKFETYDSIFLSTEEPFEEKDTLKLNSGAMIPPLMSQRNKKSFLKVFYENEYAIFQKERVKFRYLVSYK